MANSYDLVIRGGRIVDGSGGEPFDGDVAVVGNRIAAVGRIDGRGAQEIDAAGCIVTPGFVDIHTHYDGQITWENTLTPSSNHGVTTVLMGNCGVGFAPCKPEDRERLISVMEGVEDIPEVVMTKGLPWNWESFPSYMDMLATRHADVDFAAQVPHAPVRVNVMGQRGADREPATDAELAQMTQIVADGIRAGAFGVSTSRSIAHRDAKGALAPMVRAEERELMALAHGLRAAGAGVFQLLPAAHEGFDPTEEMELLKRIVDASGGRPLSFSLLNTMQFPEQMSVTLDLLDRVAAENYPIKAQVFSRFVGVLQGLGASFHPFRFHPSYKAIAHLPLAERVRALSQPDMRARLLAEEPEHTNMVYLYFVSQAAELFPLGDPPNYEPNPDDKLGARAAQMGIDVKELIYDLMLERNGEALFLLPASNFVGASLEPVRRMLEHPQTLVALGDGGAHYGTICDSSYPTFVLAYWTRDRTLGKKLPLPWAIRALSHANTEAIGIKDRGLVAPGLLADLNVIDYDALQLRAPQMVHNLPAGGGRLTQQAEGYVATIKSGVITYRNGQPTGQLPGRLLRNPVVAP